MTKPDQAGWYDDPHDANAQRYWDGRGWTPHLQRKATPGHAPPQPPQMPPPAPVSTPPWMPPPPPGPIGGQGPWEQVRPYMNQARDGGRQFWSHQSPQRKVIWALAGVAVAIVAAIVFSSIFGGGGPSGGGKSTAAFCAELNSLWDGGVRQAHTDVVAEVVSAHQAGAQPISSASLGQTAKNAQKLADDAPPELKRDLTLIAQELSTVAAGNIASLPSPPGGDDTVVVGWQAYHCNALTGNS